MSHVRATEVLPVDPAAPDPTVLRRAADLIRAGELVAFPTETVYGLGADAFSAAAISRIFVAKGRPANDPVIVHIADRLMLPEVALIADSPIRAVAERLADAFWPGPLTLVLPRGPRVPSNVSAGLPTVAVRMPAHPVALALIRAAGTPIAAPSANLFAHTSPTTAEHVRDDLAGRVGLILDAGPTAVGVESTILDLTTARPRLLRPGGVPLEAIQPVLAAAFGGAWAGIDVVERYAADATEALPSPGLLLRHYSPRAALRLYEGADSAVRAALLAEAQTQIAAGAQVGLLVADEDRAALASLPGLGASVIALGPLAAPETVARNLFAGLRDLDGAGVTVILARLFPTAGLGAAIRDRLVRAAEGRITRV